MVIVDSLKPPPKKNKNTAPARTLRVVKVIIHQNQTN